jgi:hypothetical protein
MALTVSTTSSAETRFTIIDSSPTSWVARGYDNYTVSPANGWTSTPSRNFDQGIGLLIQGPIVPGTAVDYWRLNFAAPNDAVLTPGAYPNFERWPFQASDRPGLEFASTGRLDNRASGFFQVLEASYGPAGTVLSFAANFTQYGETNANNYAIVEVRYNATVPEPTTLLTLVIGTCAIPLLCWRLSRRLPVESS